MQKTYSELEREAYIYGDVALAKLYAIADDYENIDGDLLDEKEYLTDRVKDLEWQIDDLEETVIEWKKRTADAELKLKQFKGL